MNKSLINQLESRTKDELLELVTQLAKFKGVTEFIKLNLSNPDKAIQELKKLFDRYKKTTRFYDYYETISFFDELTEQILLPIENKFITSAPLESANLIQYMLDNFEKLADYKDDSSGCAMDYLYKCIDLWGKSWHNVEARDVKKLAQLVYDYYKNQGYIDIDIFRSFKSALGHEGLIHLEEYLINEPNTLLYVIELQNNPDKYKAILEKNNLTSDIKHVLSLSYMLIDQFQSNEAIEWLTKLPANTLQLSDYVENRKLLIKAYTDDNKFIEAQNTRWDLFVKTLLPEFYTDFIKHIESSEEKDSYRKQAINYALQANNFNDTLLFMESIQEYDALEDLVINNLNKLSEYNYSYYRKLSKALATNGKYLSATLLRRYLADNVLLQAKSKYYDYAISDLKLAIEFADNISDWQSYPDTKTYFNTLMEKHKKKYSFLEKLRPLLLKLIH